MKPSAYIFGSGASLLNLTQEEVQYLNEQPCTLSLNRYLLHWKTVGVVPKAHLMADVHFPCIKFFVETQAEIQRINQPVTYYINPRYLAYFPDRLDYRLCRHAVRRRWEAWKGNRYIVPLRVRKDNLVPFFQTNAPRFADLLDDSGWFWANSLDEPMLFFRGTLTSAVNLAAVIWPEADIKLLGVDLNSYGYFFDPKTGEETEEEKADRIRRTDAVRAAHHSKSRRMGVHATAATFEFGDRPALPPVQSVFPRIREELAKTGRELYCCNPDSLLVTDGICPYAPVIPTEQAN